MEEIKTIKEKTIELIDALKATCQTYGMGNDGNEYKIITQVFLYKFLNDKFGYEVKKVSPVLKNAEKWELAYAEMSEDDRLDIFDSLPSDIPLLNPEHLMERFEKRQDKRDEQRHQESVKAQAVSFISKYYKDRGLIPLCAIATMYNDLFYYNREMYREFCCCTKEVQNRILEYCDLDLRVSEYNIYEKCLVAIESVLNKRFPDDKSVFYDGGKYFTRSLEYYADKPIPHQEFEYQNHITDVLANAFNSNDKKETPIQQLSVEYSFGSCKEIEACQLVTVIAEFAAIYGNKNKNIDKSYGSPGGYDGEVIETMEDLFLLALFEIYTNCVL